MKRCVAGRSLGKALVATGLLHERTANAEIVLGVEGALMLRSERYILDHELPQVAEAFAALAKELEP